MSVLEHPHAKGKREAATYTMKDVGTDRGFVKGGGYRQPGGLRRAAKKGFT